MRARSLMLFGGALACLAAIGGWVFAAIALDPDQRITGGLFAAGALLVVLLAVIGGLAGWFGKEHSDVALVAIGAAPVGVLAGLVIGVLDDDASIGVAAVGIGFVVVAWLVARPCWWVGDAICDMRELPNMNWLLPPAYPDEYPGTEMWTTTAGPTLRAELGRLADTIAPGGTVTARAIGIRLLFPRDQPVAIALVGDRLGIQPVDLHGAPTLDPIVLDAADLAVVSIRSLAADGSERKRINAYDDIVSVTTTDGTQLRLRLPYGTRGAGTGAGGPDQIRAWLRTNAATYQ